VAIAAGGNHTVALKNDGTVVSWGVYGLAQQAVPAGLSNVVAIATGDYHSMALRSDGTIVAWGFSSVGQCNVPVGLTNVLGIVARGNHSMVLLSTPSSSSPPTLSIARSAGNVVLSWPDSGTGFALQQTSSLNLPMWSAVTNSPVLVNGLNQVTLPATGNRFFRLAGQ
jgi:hypothetical protein